MISKLSIKRSLVVLLTLISISIGVVAQRLTSLTASAKGTGTIVIAGIDKHDINSVLVILKENGDAEFTFYADLQLSAQGSWTVGESLNQGVDLKITGGVVSGNAGGSGKLFLRNDGKSIDRLTIKATAADGSNTTVDFTADKTPTKEN